MRKLIISMLILGMFLPESIIAKEQAQNLVNSEVPSEWRGMVKVNTKIKHSGKGSFELHGKYPDTTIFSRMIPIEMNKTYTLSAWMRTLDKQFPASAFMGLRMYDKNKRAINRNNVFVHPRTETTLAFIAAKGAKELQIVKNPEWLKLKYSAIAFNAEAKYQDLPNFDISSQIEKIIDEGRLYKVILRTPLKKAYPAGTKIRLHSAWAAPFYRAAGGWMPTKWKKFSVTMSGEAETGAPGHQFWKGTKYVRVIVWFGDYSRKLKKGARLLVDDIKFTSLPTPIVKVVGHLKWPKKWRIFGPLSGNDRLNESELKVIPKKIEINGQKFSAKEVTATNNKLDFEKIYGKFGKKDVAYVFGTIMVPRDGNFTFGMGADWWMQVWIDGRLICDTTTSGNRYWPPAISNYKHTIYLSKGKHIIAVRFVSGTGSSLLALGGPDQLRKK